MASVDALVLYIGEDVTYRITVTDADGERYDLEQFTDIEFEAKAQEGAPDPARIAKTLDGGDIVLLDQSAEATKGQADITVAAADSASLVPGTLRYDVIGIHATEGRKLIIAPSDLVVRGAVNLVPVAP